MFRRTPRTLPWIATAIVSCTVACGALLGLPDPELRTDDGGAGLDARLDVSFGPSKDAGDSDEAASDALSSFDGDACSLTTSESCGTCGHSCLGGACVDGGCQPVEIRANVDVPNGLLADPGNTGSVYWNTFHNDGVFAMDKTTLQVRALLPENLDGVWAVPSIASYWSDAASAPTNIYWTVAYLYGDYGYIQWAQRDGGATGEAVESADAAWNYPAPIETDGTHVFWGNRWSGEVWRMDMTGANATRIHAFDGGAYNLVSLGVDDDPNGYVFFTDGVSVYRTQKDGNGEGIFPTTGMQTGPFLIDAGWLYWFAGGALVRELTVGGCGLFSQCPTPIVPAGTFDTPTDMTSDGDYFYVADDTAGQLVRIPKVPPFKPVVVLAQADHLAYVAVDSTAIYYAVQFTDGDAGDAASEGSIWRLAKP